MQNLKIHSSKSYQSYITVIVKDYGVLKEVIEVVGDFENLKTDLPLERAQFSVLQNFK